MFTPQLNTLQTQAQLLGRFDVDDRVLQCTAKNCDV